MSNCRLPPHVDPCDCGGSMVEAEDDGTTIKYTCENPACSRERPLADLIPHTCP